MAHKANKYRKSIIDTNQASFADELEMLEAAVSIPVEDQDPIIPLDHSVNVVSRASKLLIVLSKFEVINEKAEEIAVLERKRNKTKELKREIDEKRTERNGIKADAKNIFAEAYGKAAMIGFVETVDAGSAEFEFPIDEDDASTRTNTAYQIFRQVYGRSETKEQRDNRAELRVQLEATLESQKPIPQLRFDI